MNSKILKQILHIFILLLTLSFVSAANMTIQQLIDSYDYDYKSGVINVTAYLDYMEDTNSNNINDTLVINLTTDAATAGTYTFIVELMGKNGIIINTTNKSITAGDAKASIRFKTNLFSQGKFNYTTRINDISNNLVHRKYKTETNNYDSYETGINITAFSDENINNNYIRINLTLNVTENQTSNVTVVLSYNESSISSTEEETLTAGIQTISIDFDNETIKTTHYNGNFTMDSVTISDKVIDTNKSTSVYNYETFAKTSYIASYIDSQIDTNNDNLSEYLEINFTVNIKSADTYRLEAELYDEFNNFVAYINRTSTLSIGEQVWETRVNGSDIYKTKINGPYIISYAKLSVGNETKDITYNPYTTNVSYYDDFERPPLPDLVIAMNIIFNGTTNNTNITVNISNLGEASAFNIFLDIFDNVSYANNNSLAFLSVNESKIYYFNLSNSTNETLYTAIVDFDNLVDESDESNNIVQNVEGVSSLTISSLTNITINSTWMVFEFIINNTGGTTLNSINWTLNPGDGSSPIESTISFSLSPGSFAFVYVEYNYTTEGTFTVNATAKSGSLTSSKAASLNLGNSPPVFNGPILNMTWPEDVTNNSLNLTNYFSDIDGDSLAYTSTSQINISVSINNNTGIVTLTPDANWSGIDYIIFTVFDPSNKNASSNNVTLNITPVNDPPTFTGIIPNLKWKEDTVNNSLNLSNYFTDIDGDDLNYTSIGTINITVSIDNNTGIVTLTPEQNFYGINYVIFYAFDTALNASSNNITLNVTPVNDIPAIIIPNVTTAEDNSTSINATLYANDIETPSTELIFYITNENTSEVNCNINSDGDTVDIIPYANWYGIASCNITASDNEANSTQNIFYINVTSVNDIPTLNATNITIAEDSGTNSSINLTLYASDVENKSTELAFYITAENTSKVNCDINADNQRLGITPAGNYSGLATCNVTASDLEANSTPATFYINVTPVNDQPVITSYIPSDSTPTVAENSNLQFNHTSSDVDGDSLAYSWKLDNVEKSTSQSYLYQPITGDAGIHNVVLNVSDGSLTATQNWTVTVTNTTNIDVNNLSVLYEDSTLRIFEFKIKNNANDTLTNINWSLNTGIETIYAKQLINLTQSKDIFILFSYNYTQSGDYTVTATATDGTNQDSDSISIDIEDIEASNLTVLYNSSRERIFEFIITNHLTVNLTAVNWTLNTGETTIAAKNLASLEPNKAIFVYAYYNYTVPSTYTINATAINSSLKDSANLTITIT